LSELSFGDRASVVGFDLDTRGAASTCDAPDPGDASPIPEGCAIDNSLGHLLATDDVVHADELTALIERGRTNLLVRVREFTGTPDDDAVAVDLLIAAPFDSLDVGEIPAFDGSDEWPVSSRSADIDAPAPINAPLYTSDEAYLSAGRLAAHFEEALVRLPLGMSGIPPRAFDMLLENVSLTCTLTEVGDLVWRLDDCTLGGLWATQNLLGQLPESVDQLDPPNPLCTDSIGYPVLKDYFCRFTSRARAGGSACDALSVGLRFQTVPALASNVFTIEPRASACGPDAEPGADACN
jgi:hypothetical protein